MEVAVMQFEEAVKAAACGVHGLEPVPEPATTVPSAAAATAAASVRVPALADMDGR